MADGFHVAGIGRISWTFEVCNHQKTKLLQMVIMFKRKKQDRSDLSTYLKSKMV